VVLSFISNNIKCLQKDLTGCFCNKEATKLTHYRIISKKHPATDALQRLMFGFVKNEDDILTV
jgi:hypothetical protein